MTFSWSKDWGLKFYQNGFLVNETGKAELSVNSATNPTDGLFIIGNRFVNSDVKTADNFQLHGLTVWPRLVSQAQIKEKVETGMSRMCFVSLLTCYHINNVMFIYKISSF